MKIKYRFCFTLILKIQDEREKGDRLKLMKYLDISRDNDRHDTMRAFYLYVNDLNPQNNPEKKYHCLHLVLRK